MSKPNHPRKPLSGKRPAQRRRKRKATPSRRVPGEHKPPMGRWTRLRGRLCKSSRVQKLYTTACPVLAAAAVGTVHDTLQSAGGSLMDWGGNVGLHLLEMVVNMRG